jgi:hypothetical protein
LGKLRQGYYDYVMARPDHPDHANIMKKQRDLSVYKAQTVNRKVLAAIVPDLISIVDQAPSRTTKDFHKERAGIGIQPDPNSF